MNASIHRSASNRNATAQRAMRRARARLNSCPQFLHRADSLRLTYEQGVLIVRGQVPSFYLKSVLSYALSDIVGIQRVDNRVDVVSCEGLSSLPEEPPPSEGVVR